MTTMIETDDPRAAYAKILAESLGKTASSDKKTWELDIPLGNSVFQNNGIFLQQMTFQGNQSYLNGIIKVTVKYRIQKSIRVQVAETQVTGLFEAITFVWKFLEEHHLCYECCSLLKKGEGSTAVEATICQACSFFVFYSRYRQKTEKCSICQEDCYRTMLPCGHQFHLFCLKNMDRDNFKCPICRNEVSEDLLDDIFSDHGDLDSDLDYDD